MLRPLNSRLIVQYIYQIFFFIVSAAIISSCPVMTCIYTQVNCVYIQWVKILCSDLNVFPGLVGLTASFYCLLVESFYSSDLLCFIRKRVINLMLSHGLSVKPSSTTNVEDVFIYTLLSQYVSAYLMAILSWIVQIIQRSCYSYNGSVVLVQLCV
jgi:hypothetical protein